MNLRIWRQAGPRHTGKGGLLVTYQVSDISPDMSFLEMLDVLNEQLNAKGEEPIAFDSDCREGICGMCGLMISGEAHGPEKTTTCQLHMRSFRDGEEITIEPWRADAFPVIKDLVVDRGAFDRIIQAGGYISVNTGSAPDAHAAPVPKPGRPGLHGGRVHRVRRLRRGLPERLGAMLFMGAKVTHLGELPQGQPERMARVVSMVDQHDHEGFGGCTNVGACSRPAPRASRRTSSPRSTTTSWRRHRVLGGGEDQDGDGPPGAREVGSGDRRVEVEGLRGGVQRKPGEADDGGQHGPTHEVLTRPAQVEAHRVGFVRVVAAQQVQGEEHRHHGQRDPGELVGEVEPRPVRGHRRVHRGGLRPERCRPGQLVDDAQQ
jgi:succinate dehydrogenase / fumarate reductase iron-sulfur subunit